MKNWTKSILMFSILLSGSGLITSCEKVEGIEDSNTFTNESQLNLLSTDPVISEFQKYGTVVKAPEVVPEIRTAI